MKGHLPGTMWAQRLDAFVRRKEREARDAVIDGLVTLDDRSDALRLGRVGNPWTRTLFDGWFYWTPRDDGRSLNLVFVQSREGNTVAGDPGALGGGDTDRHLIYEGLSRVHADAVLAGARTVAESDLILSVWHPEILRLRRSLGKPRHPAQVVVSERGALSITDELIFNVPDISAILITTDAGAAAYSASLAARPWVQVLTTGPSLDMSLALERLAAEHQLPIVSCIGGRTMAATLLDAALVQDLYLTTSPASGGEPNTPLPPDSARKSLIVRKAGLRAASGVVFEHVLVV